MIYSDFTRQEYEEADFLKLIEKRVRKDLRIENVFDVKKTYYLIDDNRLSTKILAWVLENIFSKQLNLAIVPTPINGAQKINSDCLEEYISKRLHVFLNKEELNPLFDTTITPLRRITQQEILALANILGIQGKEPASPQELITYLQTIYPQTKSSFLQSFVAISKLNK